MRMLRLLNSHPLKASSLSCQAQRHLATSRFVKPAKTNLRSNGASPAASSAKITATTKETSDSLTPMKNRKESFSTATSRNASNYNKRTVPAASETPTPISSDVPSTNDNSYFPAIEQFDAPLATTDNNELNTNDQSHNWSTSFFGLSTVPFPSEVADILQQELNPNDVEIKPDGLLYLPEIKYRRILNKAFGPGGWGLAPRGEHSISNKNISREYALVCHGRFVSQARGEQDFFDTAGLPTASEGCKSNALMRCCKDLGIASELWDPIFIRKFKKTYCTEVWAEHVTTKRKKKLWRKKDDVLEYPYKENS